MKEVEQINFLIQVECILQETFLKYLFVTIFAVKMLNGLALNLKRVLIQQKSSALINLLYKSFFTIIH